MSIPTIARQVVTGVCVAVALLTLISAITLAQPQPQGHVPDWLRQSVVTGLCCSAGLALLVAVIPRIRNGIGDSRGSSLTAAGVLLIALMVNAVSLGGGLARSPQSFTSLLAGAVALGGSTLAALSITPREPTRDDHSRL